MLLLIQATIPKYGVKTVAAVDSHFRVIAGLFSYMLGKGADRHRVWLLLAEKMGGGGSLLLFLRALRTSIFLPLPNHVALRVRGFGFPYL